MKEKYQYIYLLFLVFFICCNTDSTTNKENIKEQTDFTEIKFEQSLDEIKFNPKTDDPEIKICTRYAFQYFELGSFEYLGGKPKLVKEILSNYNSVNIAQESGLIRIRFLVNCEGKANRFRLLGMDTNYQEKIFDKSITNQLLDIVKRLDGWVIQYYKETPRDYYQYLLFKIENGKIIKILP